jgi:hypothetical protein
VRRALVLGILLSLLSGGLWIYIDFLDGSHLLWWTSIPYGVRHAIIFLIVPGAVAGWVLLNATGSAVVAFTAGFSINGLIYAAVLLVPLLILEALQKGFNDG